MAIRSPSPVRIRDLVVLALAVACLVVSGHLVSCPSHVHVAAPEHGAATSIQADAPTDEPHVGHATDCVDEPVRELAGAPRIQQVSNASSPVALPASSLLAATNEGAAKGQALLGIRYELERRCLFGAELLTAFCVSRV